jgi:hypothetical protein
MDPTKPPQLAWADPDAPLPKEASSRFSRGVGQAQSAALRRLMKDEQSGRAGKAPTSVSAST